MFSLRPSGVVPRLSRLIPSDPLKALLLPAITTAPPPSLRPFSTTRAPADWLQPKSGITWKAPKGRPRVPTGGSTRGTTVVWGDYGMRIVDYHRRISALQLKNGEETIKRKLRGMKFRLYMRVAANIPVFTKGNETRMGSGKGSMDYWSTRVHVGRVIFELKGEIHEKVAMEAFRLAAAKMPGKYEFVRKGDVAMMGITKLTPENTRELVERKKKYPYQIGLRAFNPPESALTTGVVHVPKMN